MSRGASVWVLVALCLTLGAWTCLACNKMVCASIVSKCMLTQACKCDLTKSPENSCTCCRDCVKCLGYLYTECCSCLLALMGGGEEQQCLCERISETIILHALRSKASTLPSHLGLEERGDERSLYERIAGMCEPRAQVLDRTDSQVGDLPEAFPQLFQALTGEKDMLLRWTSMTFPIDIDLTDIDDTTHNRNKYKLGVVPAGHPEDTTHLDQVTVNCTVMYMSQCMSGNKCKETCRTTGATAYRWFFDGCCECVGSTCVNYGVNESRCIQCPMVDDEEFDEQLTDQYLAGGSEPFDETEAQGVENLEDAAK